MSPFEIGVSVLESLAPIMELAVCFGFVIVLGAVIVHAFAAMKDIHDDAKYGRFPFDD